MNILGLEWHLFKIWVIGLLFKLRFGFFQSCKMIILSDEDPELNYYAIKHLPDLFKRLYLKKVIIVSASMDKLPAWKELDGLKIILLKMKKKRIDTFKELSLLGSQIIAIDITWPEEKMLAFLPGLRGLTKEDILCRAEYLLFDYERITYEDYWWTNT